jgi:hypothetical protein
MAGGPVHQNERGMRMGRWKKYKTAEDFESAVESYFNGITYLREMRYPDVWLNGGWVKGDPILGLDGEPMTMQEYIYTPSMCDLENYLMISRETMSNYRERKGYRDAIEDAERRIKAYKLRLLDDPSNKNSRGLIFDLENNHGMRERRDDTVSMTSADLSDALTPEQKLEALRKLDLIHEDGDPP